MSDELLHKLLARALEEGALGPERLEAFAAALQERASAILEERLRPLEGRAAGLERELEWRKTNETNLAADRDVLRDQLRAEHERFEAQGDWLRGEIKRLETTMAALDAERQAAATAHDRLQEHHRHVVSDALAVLEGLISSPPQPSAREEVARLAEALKKELG